MFSNGQLLFGLIFFVSFIIIVSYSYKKDLKKLNGSYTGIKWVIIGFITFVSVLLILKKISVS
jgi:ABC-type transport system involved in cytochrome c biogenesis permease component|tara:strand:- start:528 stop:716 length:189 start_codon:yes stop_codon:yes gene_type:complete